MSRKSIITSALTCLALIVAIAGMALSGGRFADGRSVVSPVAYLRTITNGAGTSTAASYHIFTVSGSFAVPSGVARMIIEARGAGGGGGAGANGGLGGGGGQGGWVRVLVKVKAGAVYEVTVGQGGVGGSAAVAGGHGNTGGSTKVRPRGKSVLTAIATGGDGGLIGQSCDFVFHNGPTPGGSAGSALPPTDPVSIGLDAVQAASGGPAAYLPPSCPSKPIGGKSGGHGFAGAGGIGGASPADGHDGWNGLVIVTFLS